MKILCFYNELLFNHDIKDVLATILNIIHYHNHWLITLSNYFIMWCPLLKKVRFINNTRCTLYNTLTNKRTCNIASFLFIDVVNFKSNLKASSIVILYVKKSKHTFSIIQILPEETSALSSCIASHFATAKIASTHTCIQSSMNCCIELSSTVIRWNSYPIY